ncbi:MAG: T9SS type A sorting domain-containing protein [Chitinophagales bacterium]
MFRTITLLMLFVLPVWIGGTIFSTTKAQTTSPILQNSPVVAWYGNDNFSFAANEDILKVSMDKHPFEGFTLQLADLDLDLKDELLVSVKVKTAKQIDMRIDLHDGTYSTASDVNVIQTVVSNEKFATITYDFSSIIDKLQTGEIPYMLFCVNPGFNYEGEVYLKDLSISTGSEDVSVGIDALVNNGMVTNELSVFPNPASEFTNIQLPANHAFKELILQNITGKTILHQDIPEGLTTMQLKNLGRIEKGLYLLSVYGETEVLTTKLSIY